MRADMRVMKRIKNFIQVQTIDMFLANYTILGRKRKISKKPNSIDISAPKDFKHVFHYPNSQADDEQNDTMRYMAVSLNIYSPYKRQTTLT